MHSTLKQWLKELENEINIVASVEINEEANGNMFTFGCNEEMLHDWGKGSVTEFLSNCASLYQRKNIESPMIFYAWLDEQAGQIRISAVSLSHGKLPFGCKLNLTNIESVVSGIFSSDSGLFTNGVLDVWQKNI